MPDKEPPESTDSRPRVLVVDDERDLLELAPILLEPHGLRVDTAEDGQLGLAAARAVHFDVIVLDITMPRLDGIELGRLLRSDSATADSLIIVHTALSEGWVRSVFADYDLFLSKPDESSLLAPSIVKLLRDRDARAETR